MEADRREQVIALGRLQRQRLQVRLDYAPDSECRIALRNFQFNRVTYAVVGQAKKEGLPLEPFTVHNLRRTGSTLLNELGFESDSIKKYLAHEDARRYETRPCRL